MHPQHLLPLPRLTTSARLLPVPGGTFRMGSDDTGEQAEYDGKPAHSVTLSDFYLGEFPVTQDLWTAVMGDMGENPAHFNGERLPIERVSWFDAAVFCNRLSVETGRIPCYRLPDGQTYGCTPARQWTLPNGGEVSCNHSANGYRLPTEAEWEYAARGGASNAAHSGTYAGSDLLDQVAWYDGNSDSRTHEVGLLLPNALGCYDMSGNVWEWCNDRHGNYDKSPKTNPPGPEKGFYRVLRGGGWFLDSRYCRTACRDGDGPDDRFHPIGFRLALQVVG